MANDKEPLVCIAYPSGEFVHVKFVSSLLALISYTSQNKIGVALANIVSSRITLNRNRLIEQAKEFGASHILFVDSDMAVPADSIQRLLSYNLDVVCATASKREDGDRRPLGTPVDFMDAETSKALVEMEYIGLPLMLLRMEVFDKLKKPYFAEPVTIDGDVEGEDTYFCRKLREAGYKIFCDMILSTFVGHIGTKVYTIETEPKSPEISQFPSRAA